MFLTIHFCILLNLFLKPIFMILSHNATHKEEMAVCIVYKDGHIG